MRRGIDGMAGDRVFDQRAFGGVDPACAIDARGYAVEQGPVGIEQRLDRSDRFPRSAAVTERFDRHAPWPYIPADLLPIFIALGARADGAALFWNKVYEGAMGWTRDLARFGVRVMQCDPHRVMTIGGLPLVPAEVESPYIIRVALALLMIAVSVEGRSVIHAADPIRRAHPHFAENLRALGAQVHWAE